MEARFAASIARDALRQAIPPESSLLSLYASIAQEPLGAAASHGQGITRSELKFHQLVLRQIDWTRAGNEPGSAVAARSAYSEIDAMLPGLVRRHWLFKAILAALVMAVGLAFFGVLKFNGLEFDIQHRLDDKEKELQAQVARNSSALFELAVQAGAMSASIADSKARVVTIAADATKQITEARDNAARESAALVKDRVSQAETAAREVIAKSAADARTAIDGASSAAVTTINGSVKTKLDYLTNNGMTIVKDDITKLQANVVTLKTGVADAGAQNEAIAKTQKQLAARQDALSKGLTIAQIKDPALLERATVYLGEDVRSVRIGLAVFGGVVVLNLALVGWYALLRRRLAKKIG